MTRAPARSRRGFTLLEVRIAMALLLVGGVSILSVFTLAVAHRVERDVEAKLDLVRTEARMMAQGSVDAAAADVPPAPLVDAPTSQTGFTVTVRFQRSPNGDASWVALASISLRGQEIPRGKLPPMFLFRNVHDADR